jgi:hypothetical protein
MTVSLILESENGNINLTQYLDVEEGDGMDPADPEFTEKIFAHSLLKQGGTLALENFKLKEMAFPLKLRAANKDSLTALISEINLILNTAGCVASWQDEGASKPTYFQLASGQCDPQFKYRMGEQNWIPVKLRLFVQPFGYRTASPVAITNASGQTYEYQASAPVMTFHAASPVAGDVSALLGTLGLLTDVYGGEWLSAVSVLPNASYNPWLPAPSSSGWTAASGGAFAYRNGGGSMTVSQYGLQGTVYAGNNRVLAIARRLNSASPAKIAVEDETIRPGSGAAGLNGVEVPAASGWAAVDCGTLEHLNMYKNDTAWGLRVTTQGSISLYGFVILPDNSTCWTKSPPTLQTGERFIELAGASASVVEQSNFGGSKEYSSAVQGTRGQIPQITPSASPPTFAFFSLPVSTATVYASSFSFGVNVWERTRYVF